MIDKYTIISTKDANRRSNSVVKVSILREIYKKGLLKTPKSRLATEIKAEFTCSK